MSWAILWFKEKKKSRGGVDSVDTSSVPLNSPQICKQITQDYKVH